MLIHATFKPIEDGDVFERKLFTDAELRLLAAKWRITLGKIADPGPKFGIEIVRFVKREAK